MIDFTDYKLLTESLDSDLGPVMRDSTLEEFAKFSLPKESHPSIRVLYNKNMDDSNMRIIKFEHPTGSVEYHLHSYDTRPGEKSGHESNIGFMNAVKLIHDDAKSEIDSGKSVLLQTPFNDQYPKYKFMVNRLATKHGKTVTELGKLPLTTAPFMTGHTLKIS